jgi:hypothetical protein
MLKSLQQEAPRSLEIARLVVELPIRIEKRDQKIQVRRCRLPDFNPACLHTSLLLLEPFTGPRRSKLRPTAAALPLPSTRHSSSLP